MLGLKMDFMFFEYEKMNFALLKLLVKVSILQYSFDKK